jgi:ribosome-binding factor A
MTGPRSYPRAERVRAAVKEVLAYEVERLRDPGLGFITITDVTMSRDLRNAKAYYTVLGEPVEVEASHDAIARATKHLRAAVAREVRLRYAPTLEFVHDPVPDRTARLDEIISRINRAEDEQ